VPIGGVGIGHGIDETAILRESVFVLGAVVVEKARECLVVEVLGEPERDQEGDAHLLVRRLLADPARERASPGSGDRERTAIACARLARPHEAARLERLQLAVHVARRDVPEPGQAAACLFEEVPAGRGPLMEEPEQGSLGRVEPADFRIAVHLDIPFWRVSLDANSPQGRVNVASAATLEDDGYCVVEDVIDGETVAGIRAELTHLLDATPFGRDDFEGHRTRRVYALFAKTRALDELAVHPMVLDALDRVLGPAQLSAPTAIEIGPGERAQPLHPDDAIYPVPRPHPELVVNVMWPLDDFTENNGATRVVPGSHRWVDERPGPDAETVAVTMPAGSAMLYVGSLWHGGGANATPRARVGVVLHYAVSWLRQVENHVLAVPPDVVRGLPERLQELLGYNVYPPFLGYVDGRHPRRLLGGDRETR
jgi:ectoine hydroxylase-related dioxygenase (phytanoyl-CoA dioxygenase family)